MKRDDEFERKIIYDIVIFIAAFIYLLVSYLFVHFSLWLIVLAVSFVSVK